MFFMLLNAEDFLLEIVLKNLQATTFAVSVTAVFGTIISP